MLFNFTPIRIPKNCWQKVVWDFINHMYVEEWQVYVCYSNMRWLDYACVVCTQFAGWKRLHICPKKYLYDLPLRTCQSLRRNCQNVLIASFVRSPQGVEPWTAVFLWRLIRNLSLVTRLIGRQLCPLASFEKPVDDIYWIKHHSTFFFCLAVLLVSFGYLYSPVYLEKRKMLRNFKMHPSICYFCVRRKIVCDRYAHCCIRVFRYPRNKFLPSTKWPPD